LETSLGGGKTHNLIALYHAARGALDGPTVVEFMDPANLPEGPVEQVGVFVGTGAGATAFPTVAGVTPRSLWGYLALQLGGPAAYEEVRADDEGLRAPGASQLKRVLGGRPSLVLIDEIARYYEVAQAVAVGNSTLAKQVNAFLMALMEAVDTQERAVLVVTTTGTTGAFGDATGEVMDALGEGAQLLARKEHVLHPSEEADLPAILSRRLFAEVDETARSEVGRRALATPRGQDLTAEPSALAFLVDAPVVDPRHLDLDRSRPCGHHPGPGVTVTHHKAMPVVVDLVDQAGGVGVSLGLQCTSQHPPGALPTDHIQVQRKLRARVIIYGYSQHRRSLLAGVLSPAVSLAQLGGYAAPKLRSRIHNFWLYLQGVAEDCLYVVPEQVLEPLFVISAHRCLALSDATLPV